MKYNISSPESVAKWKAGFPSAEHIEKVLVSLVRSDEDASRAAQQRMENYYNCLDDYSWGGICDRAAAEARADRDAYRAVAKIILAGEVPSSVFTHYCLYDLAGDLVSDRVVDTKFGRAFIIRLPEGGVKFVSVAKKLSTYAKKGYKLMKVDMYYDYYLAPGTNGFYQKAIITKVEWMEAEEGNHHPSSYVPDSIYRALRLEEEREAHLVC